jgi:ribonuclease G
MYISSSPHETKVAVLEDDQLVEVYFERDTDVGLVGGIYKGRVSRVLPGMQSAFVDIGLERDAFLYVSDFYEDQEEYDKVFGEAEARATKFTAQQAEVPGAPTVETASTVIEPPPPAVAEVAPPPPLPTAPPVVPSPVEVPAATFAPPTPVAAPPPHRESDRRPFDPRRGRRRHHRGRPEFGEGRHGDRRFPPPHRQEESPTESHAFEILPGESLAKYSHATPAPLEETKGEMPEGLLTEVGQDAPTAAEAVHLSGNASIEGDESVEQIGLAVEAVEVSTEAPAAAEPIAEAAVAESAVASGPATEAAEVEPIVATELPPEPPATATAVVADATMPFAPGAIQVLKASAAAESAPAEVAGAPVSTSTPPVQSLPEEPAPLELAASASAGYAAEPVSAAGILSSSFAAEVAASYSVEGIAGPSSGEAEAKEVAKVEVPGEAAPMEASESAETMTPPESAEAVPESSSESAEFDVPEEEIEGEEESLEEAELLAEASEGELDDEGELPAEGAAGADGEGQPAVQEAASGDGSTAAAPDAPGDRTYTLREPNQRPRFGPRRRRGRRSPGGGPRRFDKPRDSSRPGGNHHPVQIAEVLKEGQEIVVQIAKEPLGTKGARITSHVALPGRYLVYMPTIDHIGVSRKIASEEERLRLRNIILENKGALTGGFIVRTAGQGRPEEEFKADLRFLSTLWSEIRSKSDRLKAPALLHRDLDLVQRLLRDLLTPDFKCVRVDSEIDYERVLDFVNRCQPALVGKVKLYTRDTPLYEEFGIQQEIEKALKPKVWLKSGGYIVINQTEALVAIDVNTGKYVGKTNRLEDTIVKTNVDAVNEIVRQVRLRDLGGIIVIDFIDMDERKNRAKVVQALEEALRSDRAPTKVISFHDFGLVAVTRKRVKQSLERTLCVPCSYCTGSGWVKSVNTVCNEILAEARKMAKEIDGPVMTLRVNPEVAKALKLREGGLVSELESLTRKDVIIKSDSNVHQERFEIY